MRILLSLVLAVALISPAFAAYTGPASGGKQGGYTGPMSGVQASKVAEALKLGDDAGVVLTGK